MKRFVTFLDADPRGLWKAGDTAEYLGLESDDPDAPEIHLFNLRGETIALYELPRLA